MPQPGPRNLITDVEGLKVGHATDERAQTGVSVLLCPGGWTAAVDVRGGGPGARDLDALSLENLVGRVHAITLSGGSVFGLAAADGVTAALAAKGEGLMLHPSVPLTPIVPGAVLYDLTNAGDKAWELDPPYRRLGLEALAAAESTFAIGLHGAGRGARAGTLPGGLGSASVVLEGGLVVGALVAINPLGSVYMPDGETFWAWPFEMNGEFGGRIPTAPILAHDPIPDGSRLEKSGRMTAGANTTLAVIAVSADLTAPQCKRVAIMAHDGMARAIRPAHTPFDGDIVFAVAKGQGEDHLDHRDVARIGAAAADCLARAIARGVYASAHPAA